MLSLNILSIYFFILNFDVTFQIDYYLMMLMQTCGVVTQGQLVSLSVMFWPSTRPQKKGYFKVMHRKEVIHSNGS